jgi:hypothetical protein
MDTRYFIYFTILGLTLILSLGVIVPPAKALTIAQGEDVYLGECGLDISMAISWPDYTVAWCKSGYAGCLPPDQVIQITGFQHNFCIDERFHPGWYYRWDGNWNGGENYDAFRVRVGTRPVVNATPIPTPKPTLVPGIDARGNGPFTWLITRGDGPDILFKYNSTSDVCGTGPGNSKAHLWLWGSTTTFPDRELSSLGKDNYELGMNSGETSSLVAGKYTGYIQFPGVNGRQDVFWDPVSRCIDTPYDDVVYPDIVADIRFPVQFRADFERVAKDMKYSDDLLVPVTMNVVDPTIRITDIVQGEDKLFISGVTSWSNGTEITLRLDPDNYALASDKKKHTWTVKATGDLPNERVFSTTVPIDMKDMYLGVHELKMTVDKNGWVSDVYHDFKVTGLYVMPTPTPVLEKYITDMNGNRFVTLVPTTEPTPIPTPTEKTPVPTPKPTVVIPVETTPSITLPLNPWMGLLALCVAWVVVRR